VTLRKNVLKPVVKLRVRENFAPPLPTYATEGSAGADVCSNEDVVIFRGEWTRISTGYDVEVPPDYKLEVWPRSGLASTRGVTVLNSPGLIDSDYRGELCVILINHGSMPYEVKWGDRIAQLVLTPVYQASFVGVTELSETERGEGGFGSTGV
jgi:dUTP pyrophosphatase